MKSKKESLEILNLTEDASRSEIDSRYNELYSDFQIRLTNAPTPNLKKLYQKNLQEIEDAYAQITGGTSKSDKLSTDLPSAKPVKSSTSSQNFDANKTANEVIAGRNLRQSQQNQKNVNSNTAKGVSFTVVTLISVFSLAIIAFLVTLYLEGRSEVKKMEAQSTQNAEFLKLKNFIKNGKFRIENRCDYTIIAIVSHVTFLNNKNELEEFKFLGTPGFPNKVEVTIPPGKTVNINQYEGAVKWDGSVVSYSMIIYDEQFNIRGIYSGIWHHEWSENKAIVAP
jgi:ATP-dependent Zn protease